jgi:hypothetical protein
MMDDAAAPLSLSPTAWIALPEEEQAKACGRAATSGRSRDAPLLAIIARGNEPT